MAKVPVDDAAFTRLLYSVHQQTDSISKKLNLLYYYKGYFTAEQSEMRFTDTTLSLLHETQLDIIMAGELLRAITASDEKIEAVRILESRLCPVSCQDARAILRAIYVHSDRLIALNYIKRALSDHQTKLGLEYILSMFPFEHDKFEAMRIMRTVNADVADKLASGAHQLYAPLGSVYSQARPMNPHIYGSLEIQKTKKAGYGAIKLSQAAKPGVLPSMYTGHPSYAYPADCDYSEANHYPRVGGNFGSQLLNLHYPAGAAPLGFHSGSPAPTGFYGIEKTSDCLLNRQDPEAHLINSPNISYT